VALWIYWQALVLLKKGVPFHGPPVGAGWRRAAEAAAARRQPRLPGGAAFAWAPAPRWPWGAGGGRVPGLRVQ
jgi:hypothetical protein